MMTIESKIQSFLYNICVYCFVQLAWKKKRKQKTFFLMSLFFYFFFFLFNFFCASCLATKIVVWPTQAPKVRVIRVLMLRCRAPVDYNMYLWFFYSLFSLYFLDFFLYLHCNLFTGKKNFWTTMIFVLLYLYFPFKNKTRSFIYRKNKN